MTGPLGKKVPNRIRTFDILIHVKVTEDFKMVIVLDDDLPDGLMANTAAVLSLTLGNKIEGLIGSDLKDGNEHLHTALTTIPLPILKCTKERLREIYTEAYPLKDELLLVDVTDAAQTTKNYADYEQKLKQSSTDQLAFLGLALAGPQKLINTLTGNLALL